jgi:pyridoxal phosphate enzyme (YggS family)
LSPVPDIAANLAAVRSRIAAAAERVGRRGSDVTLVAVTQTFGAAHVRAAHAAGQTDFGENKVQEGLLKIAALSDAPGIRWHLIGHLQSNKARKAAQSFASIHSIDSTELLRRVDDAAAAQGTAPEVLIQVDLAGESTKFGAPPDEVPGIAREAMRARAVRLSGLMLIPPWSTNPEETRPWFVRLRQFRDRLAAADIPGAALQQLSMGMSHDFEAAVEEGATIVRVGTAIFGARHKS